MPDAKHAVLVIPAIRGLVSEGDWISKALINHEPDSLGISISKESLDGLANYLASDKKDACAELENVEEELYVAGLSRFGEVIKPPPCFVAAWRFGKQKRIPVVALDMDEMHFTNAYCRNVSGLDVMFSERRERKIARHNFLSSTPADFVLEWDETVNSSKGFRKLEEEREDWLANAICELSQAYNKPAVVLELERVAGVKKKLDERGLSYTLISDRQ